MEKGTTTVLDLAKKFQESSIGKNINTRVSEIYKNMKANMSSEDDVNKDFSDMNRYATGWLKQVELRNLRFMET